MTKKKQRTETNLEGIIIVSLLVCLIVFALGYLIGYKNIEDDKDLLLQLCNSNNAITELANQCIEVVGLPERISYLNCSAVLEYER